MTHFADTLASVQYATICDVPGRRSDAGYLPRLADNTLLLLVGAFRGPAADEAQDHLKTIRRTADLAVFFMPATDPPLLTAPRMTSPSGEILSGKADRCDRARADPLPLTVA